MQDCVIHGSRTLGTGKFLTLKALDWTDARGKPHVWETAERIGVSGAVLIIPRLEPSGRILLIRQFRPPAGCMTVEFPAGLIDGEEGAEAAAARELREETGYRAAELIVTAPSYTSPGLSSEAVNIVTAVIDENAPENRHPQPEFDGSEMIESILVPRAELAAFYRRECAAGTAFDAKLAAFILARE